MSAQTRRPEDFYLYEARPTVQPGRALVLINEALPRGHR